MARFLTTLPVNLGFVNLGTIESYPTGGTGPTGYGPTSYFGSDPLPSRLGDSINNPVNLGNFTSVYKTLTISNSHGGLTRQQSSFYKLKLLRSRALKINQNYSQFSRTSNTNKNTLVSFYRVENGTHRKELPINNSGYVVNTASNSDGDEDSSLEANTFASRDDYNELLLGPGEYILLITNDIRYLETTYSFTIEIFSIDWRYVNETVEEALNFDLVTDSVATVFDLGSLAD